MFTFVSEIRIKNCERKREKKYWEREREWRERGGAVNINLIYFYYDEFYKWGMEVREKSEWNIASCSDNFNEQ